MKKRKYIPNVVLVVYLTIILTSINISFFSLSGDAFKNKTQHINPIIQSIQIQKIRFY